MTVLMLSRLGFCVSCVGTACVRHSSCSNRKRQSVTISKKSRLVGVRMGDRIDEGLVR